MTKDSRDSKSLGISGPVKTPINKTELGNNYRALGFRRTNWDCEIDFESDIKMGTQKYLYVVITKIFKYI